MIGDQIKYEPAWVLNQELKKNINSLNAGGCTKTLAGKQQYAIGLERLRFNF
jgi:hypothetical protein